MIFLFFELPLPLSPLSIFPFSSFPSTSLSVFLFISLPPQCILLSHPPPLLLLVRYSLIFPFFDSTFLPIPPLSLLSLAPSLLVISLFIYLLSLDTSLYISPYTSLSHTLPLCLYSNTYFSSIFFDIFLLSNSSCLTLSGNLSHIFSIFPLFCCSTKLQMWLISL